MDPVVRIALEELGRNPELVARHLCCCHEKDVVLSQLYALHRHGHRYDVDEVAAWFCARYGGPSCASVRRWVEAVAWGGCPGYWKQELDDPAAEVRRWEEEALVPA